MICYFPINKVYYTQYRYLCENITQNETKDVLILQISKNKYDFKLSFGIF